MSNLSTQALWYIMGKWPIIHMNDFNPESSAMKELTDKGYAIYVAGKFPHLPKWQLTLKGEERKAMMEGRWPTK